MAAISAGVAAGAAALGALGSLGSTAINAGTTAYQNDLQRQHEKEMLGLQTLYKVYELEKSNALDRKLRSTQYQDAVADMKAAGINPAALGQSIGQVSAATPSSANVTGSALAFGANNILLSAVKQTALDHPNRLKHNVKKIAISTAQNINRNL